MDTFFELVSHELNLGGPMGTETTPEIFRESFSSEKKAMTFAEEDHKRRRFHDVPIRWERRSNSDGSYKRLWSGDLGSHDYAIFERTIK